MQQFFSWATAPARTPWWRAALAALTVVITTLALIPHPPAQATTGWDKSNHALAFASLAFCGVWALWREPRQWPALAGAVLAYGGAIEVAQSFLPPRSGEWADLLADALGIALGLVAAATVRRVART
ncbi:VanZ family protein [Roseateles sp. BYS87W]|uniref:VanZ family protein n=1 Tax=Pelomonas baiyunensis TaxID=3299026 RepID=A0ABW7H3S7_9BURK